jgi:Omp85 superfamily domain/WD40-like Beta Propeller Repeat
MHAVRLRLIAFIPWLPVLLLVSTLRPAFAHAQDFGQNKVRYRTFDFKVLKTEHFDIYYYDDERGTIEDVGRMAERWYDRLSKTLDHTLSRRQPMIVYASHPQFEQTNAIPGDLGEGTGGVTEFLKRRIVLPLAGTPAETDHVIGHELVHAFQFDIAGEGHSGISLGSGGGLQLPLWFVEGMAEYLSIGPVDPHTAMWMRDAAQSNKLPSYARLDDPRYFPYRFGQALWAYVAGRYGEAAVGRTLKAAGHAGDPARAFRVALGVGPDTLVRDWHQATRDWNHPIAALTNSASHDAHPLILARSRGGSGGGRLNLAPALSPDGNRIVFLSERSLFSIDMYLADAHTGRVLRQITRTALDPHFQSLQFIQSAGAWSPDGRQFAFAAVSRGIPLISVLDVATGRVTREASFPALGEIFNPTWAPDGQRIAFSAIEGGLTDLWSYDFATKQTRRLTHDRFADIEPAWSPDGRHIAFVTDRFDPDTADVPRQERLALLDPDDLSIRPLVGFATGKHINPQWSRDGGALTFISDRDGISNLYRTELAGDTIVQLTNLLTGVSGITPLSPAVSVARDADRVAFSVYEGGNYDLYTLEAPRGTALQPARAENPAALPPLTRAPDVPRLSVLAPTLARVDTSAFQRATYRPRLSLDYVSQPTLGVATGSSGVAAGGGAALYWSDMLGNHNLATLLQVNNAGGSFFNNVTAGVGYENLRSRWNWGASLTQIPYITSGFGEDVVQVGGVDVIRDQEERFWQIERTFEADVSYPFSRFQRIEFTGGVRSIDFAGEIETRLFSPNTGDLLVDTTTPTGFDSLPTLNLGTAGMALVYDNSVFGGTSPVLGHRYRLGVDAVVGSLQFDEVIADVRRYVMLARPLVLAGRVLHFGRYGRDAEAGALSDLFIGYPSLVRGYNDASFDASENAVFNRLLGSRLAVANVELRLPLLGALGVIPTPGVPPVELAGFFDAGTAWRQNDKAAFLGGGRQPVTSEGAALRVNILGFAVGEVDLVHPNDRPGKGWAWQFALQPGF